MLLVLKYVGDPHNTQSLRRFVVTDERGESISPELPEDRPEDHWTQPAFVAEPEQIAELGQGDGEYAIYEPVGKPNKQGLYASYKLKPHRATVETPLAIPEIRVGE